MEISLFGLTTLTITWWKVIGLFGALCFALRWVVQFLHRRRTGSSEIPTLFWVMSIVGATLTTLYFVFGKNDSVGILQSALPLFVACYNLRKDLCRPPGGATPAV